MCVRVIYSWLPFFGAREAELVWGLIVIDVAERLMVRMSET